MIVHPTRRQAVLFPTVALILSVLVFSGCAAVSPSVVPAEPVDQFLPDPGQVVYCPTCNRDLYIRLHGTGTTRTAFSRADYAPLYYDIDLPISGREAYCPFDGGDLVVRDGNGKVVRVHYRDRAADGSIR
jgi:hypothetical protein